MDAQGTYRFRFDAQGFAPLFSEPFTVVTAAALTLSVYTQPTGMCVCVRVRMYVFMCGYGGAVDAVCAHAAHWYVCVCVYRCVCI